MKTVLYYSNGATYTLKNVTNIINNKDSVTFEAYDNSVKSKRISNVVTERRTFVETATEVKKTDLLGFANLDGDVTTVVKLSDRLTTINFIND